MVGNPPFLGGSKKRGELGDAYFDALNYVYQDCVPGGADLVCYWFEKARKSIVTQGLGAAGLVATQAIRAGSNRKVLEHICSSTRIFDAWSDEPWVNEGAAVRVSLVAFGHGQCCFLNGESVDAITADLGDNSAGDMTSAAQLQENKSTSFEGAQKNGPFDISREQAHSWLGQPNPHGIGNHKVLKPYMNASDVTGRSSYSWMVDFFGFSEPEAKLFEAPFNHIDRVVKPIRLSKREAYLATKYWLLKRPAIDLRVQLDGLSRYMTTPRVAKHRFFVWLDKSVLPDSRLNSIARSDDTTFGILSSRIHEVWSLAQASMHGVGNDPTYNAKSCFETFPFPAQLTPADTAHQRTQPLPDGSLVPADLPAAVQPHAAAIASAARRLDQLRQNWLNPPEWTVRVPEVVPLGMSASPYPDRIEPLPGLSEQDAKALQKRTLTNLYNQRPAWLAQAHEALDAAVAAAYGWQDYSPAMSDEEILRRLLALNHERAGM